MKTKLFLLTLLLPFCLFSLNINNTFRDILYYPSQTCANVWGYVDSLGNEYALVGASHGMSIVNVTNPDSIWEVKQIPGPNNLWKEIRTFGHYAYCTSEGGNGLQIINLRNLPDTSLPYHYWQPTVNGLTLNKIHALHIDTATAYIYLYGCNGGFSGAMIAKLSDPFNPTYRGTFNEGYVHDGIVRNNILYASMIYIGIVRFVDVSVDTLPVGIASVQTSGAFSHNTWLSDNNKYLFTTDEINNSFLACYNIEDLQNIELIDKIQSNPGSYSVVHNTYYKNEYCFTSWYKDGYTIVDASRPHNLIQVGNYDTYNGSGTGMDGDWGVYAYLPSGNILLTNIHSADTLFDGSLIVVSPNLVRGCYFEGLVTDSISNFPLGNVSVSLFQNIDTIHENTKLDGTYATGTINNGSYTATFTKQGYFTKTIQNITLQNGILNYNAVKLMPVNASIADKNNHSQVQILMNEGILKVTSNENILSKFLEISDTNGKKVVEQKFIDKITSIDMNNLSNGVYFVKIYDTEGHFKIQKIVVQ